jgi:pyruvate kinase
MLFKRTTIGATIGPASKDVKVITAMAKAGMNFARLNFSHGEYKDHAKLIKNIRAVEGTLKRPIGIFQDLQGPKMRLGVMPEKGIAIKNGARVVFNTHSKSYTNNEIPITYPGLHKFLKVKQTMLIDDGRAEVLITAIRQSKIAATVIQGGLLTSHKGLNFPDSNFSSIPALSAKDIADVKFGVKHGVDIISLSFVKHAEDIVSLRKLVTQEEKKNKVKEPTFIVAKIERPEAIKNLKKIVAAADGIMIARGDLALEMPAEQMPILEKNILKLCNQVGKPVIVATQMLDSMQKSPRPTRAELTDVANAVMDHADALMLTNETAVGEFPVETVQTMHNIIVATEKSHYDDTPLPKVRHNVPETIALAELSRILSEDINAKAIITPVETGATARAISHTRPTVPILALTASPKLARQLCIPWGLYPILTPRTYSGQKLVNYGIAEFKKHKLIRTGNKVVVIMREQSGGGNPDFSSRKNRGSSISSKRNREKTHRIEIQTVS